MEKSSIASPVWDLCIKPDNFSANLIRRDGLFNYNIWEQCVITTEWPIWAPPPPPDRSRHVKERTLCHYSIGFLFNAQAVLCDQEFVRKAVCKFPGRTVDGCKERDISDKLGKHRSASPPPCTAVLIFQVSWVCCPRAHSDLQVHRQSANPCHFRISPNLDRLNKGNLII